MYLIIIFIIIFLLIFVNYLFKFQVILVDCNQIMIFNLKIHLKFDHFYYFINDLYFILIFLQSLQVINCLILT
jgi:hypothetical protein